jgi:hypothetical protein
LGFLVAGIEAEKIPSAAEWGENGILEHDLVGEIILV